MVENGEINRWWSEKEHQIPACGLFDR